MFTYEGLPNGRKVQKAQRRQEVPSVEPTQFPIKRPLSYPSANRTGIPSPLKQSFETRTGLSFDDVRVQYNSAAPAQFGALAYTRGNEIHIGPGQERHLPHELGHVAQQKQGKVRPTGYIGGMAVNTDARLEQEADFLSSAAPEVVCGAPSIAQFLLACRIDDQDTIVSLSVTREDFYPYYPASDTGLSHNHSTACDVFIKTVRFHFLGRQFKDALMIIEDLLNALRMIRESGLTTRETGLVDQAQQKAYEIWGNEQIPKDYKVEQFCKLYLETRSQLDYTYLPGHFPAVGHGEVGAMGKVQMALTAGDPVAAAQFICVLFDTISGPRGIDYEPYLQQHIRSIEMAFPECDEGLLVEACNIALAQLREKLGDDFSPEELQQRQRTEYRDLLRRINLTGGQTGPLAGLLEKTAQVHGLPFDELHLDQLTQMAIADYRDVEEGEINANKSYYEQQYREFKKDFSLKSVSDAKGYVQAIAKRFGQWVDLSVYGRDMAHIGYWYRKNWFHCALIQCQMQAGVATAQ